MSLQTATNPQTGERVVLVNDEWQPITRTATNKEGQKAYLVGNQWLVDDRKAAPAPTPAPAAPTTALAPAASRAPVETVETVETIEEAPAAPDVTRGAQMRAYKPSLWEKIQDLLPDNKARAMNELAARRVAQKRGIPVSQAYREAGFERPMFNPEGRAPVRAAVEAAPIVAKELKKIPAGTAETVLRTVRGGELNAVDETWIDNAIAAMSEDEKSFDKNYEAFNGLGKSLGFSVASIVASTLTGAAASATPLGPIGGVAAGMTASGTVAYRASKDEFLERVRSKLNKESKRLYGRPLTKEEWSEAQKKFDSVASEYGAWEAIPEAISNAIFLKAFAKPALGAKPSKLKSLTDKAVAYATENVAETSTGLGQRSAELKAGLSTEELDIAQAFRNQFIQTLAVTGLLGGGMKGRELAAKFYNEQVLPRVDPGSALAKAIKADLDSIGYTPAAFRAASAKKVEPTLPPGVERRAVKPVTVTPPEEPPEAPAQERVEPTFEETPPAPPTERKEPTFDEQAAAAVAATMPEGRVEPSLETPAVTAAAPAAPEARIEDSEGYKILFAEYRKRGMTKEDAGLLAIKTLQEREEMEAQATAKAMGTAPGALTPATGLPPVETWPDATVTSTLQFQLAKPEDLRNAPLVAALEQEMAARGLQLPVGEESVTEPISTPSGAGAGVAGVPPTGAPAEGAGGAERTGVVSTAEDVGQPAVGEGEQPGAVTEETAPAAPAEPKTQEEILAAATDAELAKALTQYGGSEVGRLSPDLIQAEIAKREAAAAEAAAETTAAETTITEGAPKTKRGRPKLELSVSPEELALREQKRREARTAYTRADRQATRAVSLLTSASKFIEPTGYPDIEAYRDALLERAAQRREALRTLLSLEPQFRGTKLGNRIKEALKDPNISPKELADVREGLRVTGGAKSAVFKEGVAPVNKALATATNANQALTAIINGNKNMFQVMLAKRLRGLVNNTRFVVLEAGDPLPAELKPYERQWKKANGMYVPELNAVYVRGASFGFGQGVNNVTALHEILHAATVRKIGIGINKFASDSPQYRQLQKFVADLVATSDVAKYVYERRLADGTVPEEVRRLVERTGGDVFNDPMEFLSYGMSDPDFQLFLMRVPGRLKDETAFSQFVRSIMNLFGIGPKEYSAFSDLVNVTDRILSERVRADTKVELSGPFLQAKKNGEKISKALRKVQRGREAQDVIEGVGDLTKDRASIRLQDLLAAGWDTFNIYKLKALLPGLMTDTIVQWGDRLGIKGLDRAWRGMQDMSAMRANMLTAAAEVTRDWLKLQPGIARRALGAKSEMNALADLMHLATSKGIDPDVRTTDKELNAGWKALSPKAKEIYRNVRDSYKSYFDLYRLLLDQRIEALNIPGDTKDADTPKGKVMAEIKKLYETSKAISPYFPLMRYGDYWLSIGKGKEREFYMFESAIDRDLFRRARMRQAENVGATLETEQGNSLAKLREKSVSADTTNLLKDIFEAIDEAGALADKEALKDQIYQLYLTTMPEQSFRNQFVHRKGTTGFSGDALRNYVTSTLNMANQLSRLKYGPQVLLDIEAARKSLEGRPDKDKLEMLVDEMKIRAELEIFPPAEDALARSAANVANRTAFLYLMTSVATGLAQFASLPVFGVPVLLSRHSPVQVAKEMGRFMLVFNELGVLKEEDGKIKVVMPTIAESRAVRLSPDEQIAVEAMRDRGLADTTLTYELMDLRQVPTTKYIGAWKTATNMMGAIFHNVERLNREVMYLSSFRLTMNELEPKIKSGKLSREAAIELAIEQAVNDTYTALGNFTEGNRPRIARGPIGKVALQFKTFPAFVSTFFIRNFYRMTAGMNKEEKKEAATQFFGALSMSYLLAGYVGIPGISFAFGVAQALINMFRDDEDEDPLEGKDRETWFRNVYIPNMFGETKIGDKPVSEIVDAGALNSISGYAMNSSLSMNNMWFPEVKEGATYMDTWQDYAISLMGPFAGIVLKQVPGAMDDFRAGKFDRGVEKLMPNLIRQPMVAARYSREGATTPAGDIVKDADEFTRGQLVMQALGYRTEGLADAQTANFKANAIRQKVMQEKNRLIARLDLEASQGSDEAMDDALEEVFKFNARYPMVAVKPSQLSAMLRNRMEKREQSDRGFRVDKKFYPYLEELLEPSRAKLEREAEKARKQ